MGQWLEVQGPRRPEPWPKSEAAEDDGLRTEANDHAETEVVD